jgi:hypothetical protein
MRQLMAILALLISLLVAQSAAAENLLVNGGFETGGFYGWSHQNDEYTWIIKDEHPHSGRWALRVLGPYGEVGEGFRLSQTFPTIPGQSYEVGLWGLGEPETRLKIYWGDKEILKIDNFLNGSSYKYASSPPQVAAGATATAPQLLKGILERHGNSQYH